MLSKAVRPCFIRLVPLSRAARPSAHTYKDITEPTDQNEDDVDDPNCRYENESDRDYDPHEMEKPVKRVLGGCRAASVKTSKSFICEMCGKSFSQKTGLEVHLNRHNGIKPFACALCDYNAVCKIEIVRHMTKHTGERNHRCKLCKKNFTTDSSLRNHLRRVHRRKEVCCDGCPFKTHSPDILKRHQIIKHSSGEQFVCPVCQETVKQKGAFLVHIRKHTGDKPYHCVTCSKSFKSNSQLAAHARSHRPGQFACPQCSRKFQTKDKLKRHMIIHSGEKPYSCHLCTYACNVKGNITKHIKSVHKISSFSFREPRPINGGSDDAKERGLRAADEYLKEHTQRAGEVLTLEDLKRQAQISRESEQEAKLLELKASAQTFDTCHASQVQTGLVDSDILSDAVQLLHSPVLDEKLEDCSDHYKVVSDTIDFPVEIGSNMFIIQVVSDQSIIL